MKRKTIAIEGNIGSGKTTLAKLLAQKLGAGTVLETFENNPFLPKFYTDPDRYALPAELFFLTERYIQLQKRPPKEQLVISDYTLVKSLIFAQVTLKKDELALYERVFKTVYATIPNPDLTVYLYNTPENLLAHIQKRGRPYEKIIKASYLEAIDRAYRQYYQYLQTEKILILDISAIDFLSNSGDLQKVIDLLEREQTVGVREIKL